MNALSQKILLSGYYGAGNLGDDLLLTVLVRELRSIFPHAHFIIRGHGDTTGLIGLGSNIEFARVEQLASDQRRSKLIRLILYLWTFHRLLRGCRWLVFGGGTVFHQYGGLTNLILQWCISSLARANGVAIAALGVGVADLQSGFARLLLRSIVAKSKLFLVRDEAALKQCAGTKAQLTNDLVFAWAPELANGRQRNARDHYGPVVALTIYPSAFLGPSGRIIMAALVDAVRRWRSTGTRVVFLVFQNTDRIQDDNKIFQDILAATAAASGPPIEVRRPKADADQIANAFADIDVLTGMRYHGLVLAAMLGLPFVGLAHDAKITEICRRFEMPCIDVSDLDAADLVSKVDLVRGRVPDQAVLASCVAAAQKNFQAFTECNR